MEPCHICSAGLIYSFSKRAINAHIVPPRRRLVCYVGARLVQLRSERVTFVNRPRGRRDAPGPLGRTKMDRSSPSGRTRPDAERWQISSEVRPVGGAEGQWLRRELHAVVRDLLLWAQQDIATESPVNPEYEERAA